VRVLPSASWPSGRSSSSFRRNAWLMLIFSQAIDVWIRSWWLCIIYAAAAATFRLLWVNFSLNHVYHFNVLIFMEKQHQSANNNNLGRLRLVTFQFARCVIFGQTIIQTAPEPVGIFQQLQRRHLSSPSFFKSPVQPNFKFGGTFSKKKNVYCLKRICVQKT